MQLRLWALLIVLVCAGHGLLIGQSPAFTAQQLATDHAALPARFTLFEVERFTPDSSGSSVFLSNGFASTVLLRPGDWRDREEAHAVRITLVYSRYPRNWVPGSVDHDRLLAERLLELFRVDSALNSEEIDWNIVLQHGANSEAEARALPHGVEIAYVRMPTNPAPVLVDAGRQAYNELQLKRFEKQVLTFIKAAEPTPEPTMEKVLQRHPDWNSKLVIMDWTRTMQRHSAQVLLWHVRNFASSGVRHIVLFTDGERGKAGHIGDQGGIYYVDALDLKKLTKTMRMARSRTRNPDPEESDLEAIIRGTQRFTDVDRVTLIADNSSCIRDYCLLDRIQMPVDVVLCGVRSHVNPVYVNLAQRTNGTVYTVHEDLSFDRGAIPPNSLVLQGSEFRYHDVKGRYVPRGVLSSMRRRNCERYYDLECEMDRFGP